MGAAASFAGRRAVGAGFHRARRAAHLGPASCRGADRLLAYAPGAQAQFGILESGMAVNPKTGEVIYVASVQSDTNIDLLTLKKH